MGKATKKHKAAKRARKTPNVHHLTPPAQSLTITSEAPLVRVRPSKIPGKRGRKTPLSQQMINRGQLFVLNHPTLNGQMLYSKLRKHLGLAEYDNKRPAGKDNIFNSALYRQIVMPARGNSK